MLRYYTKSNREIKIKQIKERVREIKNRRKSIFWTKEKNEWGKATWEERMAEIFLRMKKKASQFRFMNLNELNE